MSQLDEWLKMGGRKLWLTDDTGRHIEKPIVLDADDSQQWIEAKETDAKFITNEPASAAPIAWIEVTDQETGGKWIVAPATCGLDCRCAAEGFELGVEP